MPANKNATLRYDTIDSLLAQDEWHTIEDLRHACEQELDMSVSRVTIYNDINTLMGEYYRKKGVVIDKMAGKPVKYRYARNARTIHGSVVRGQSYSDLANTLEYLESISGLFNLNAIVKRIKQQIEEPEKETRKCISFQSNPELKNLDFVWTLYKHIREENPLKLRYNGGYTVMKDIEFQPWYLKQYENRWYLMGYAYRITDIWGDRRDVGLRNLAVDRIEVTQQSRPLVDVSRKRTRNVKLNEPGKEWYVDFEKLYADMIGVTVRDGEDAVEVVIRADMTIEEAVYDWNRIVTKPLLPSQEAIEGENESFIKVFIRPNNEFYDRMMEYYHLEIVYPSNVREELKRRAEILASHYR